MFDTYTFTRVSTDNLLKIGRISKFLEQHELGIDNDVEYFVVAHSGKYIIGCGGIICASDAIEFLIAGAKAVQVGTANFIEPGVCEKIIKGIEEWKKKR